MSIFPNPISTSFQINDNKDKQVILTIHNLMGAIVYEETVSTNQVIGFPQTLPFGSYILAIKDKSKIEYIKIIYAQ